MGERSVRESTADQSFVEYVRAADPESAAAGISRVGEDTRVAVLRISSEVGGRGDPANWKTLTDAVVGLKFPVILLLTGKNTDFPVEVAVGFDLCFVSKETTFYAGDGIISAGEAEKKGIVNGAFEDEEAESRAVACAEKIERLAPLAVRSAKLAVKQGVAGSLEQGFRLENGLFAALFATADMHEGTNAFLEKRAPEFSGE